MKRGCSLFDVVVCSILYQRWTPYNIPMLEEDTGDHQLAHALEMTILNR